MKREIKAGLITTLIMFGIIGFIYCAAAYPLVIFHLVGGSVIFGIMYLFVSVIYSLVLEKIKR